MGNQWAINVCKRTDDPRTCALVLTRLFCDYAVTNHEIIDDLMHVDSASAARAVITRGQSASVDGASNAQDAADFREPTLPDLIARQAALTPLSPAVVCGDRVMSYHELEASANRLARYLLHRELAPHTRIAVLLDRSVDLVVALLAILKSGSAYVPLDPAYPKERLAYVLKDARPSAVISKSTLMGSAAEDIEHILLDTEVAELFDPEHATVNAAFPDSVAYVIYTSGSTGVPKGVRIAQRSMTNFLLSMRREPGLRATDALLAVTTVAFDIAVLELFLPLIVGAKVVLARETDVVDGASLWALMKRHSVSVLQATPITWQLLIDAGWREPTLKMLCGGEALTRKLAEQLLARGGELWNMYGPTETTVWSSVLRVTQGDGPVLLGPPIDNTYFRVLDEQLRPAVSSEPGELFIGGDGVALGYVDLPQLTAEKFLEDPFIETAVDAEVALADSVAPPRIYRTGDIVRKRDDGCLEFLGRADHQVKLRGYRIELGEIEATLLRHPSVVQAVATVGKLPDREPEIWAYVVLSSEDSPGVAAVATQLRTELQANFNRFLPAYMHPAAIITLPKMPETANGKVDRKALPVPLRSAAGPARAGETSSQDVEQRLVAIWRSLLNLGEVDASANFFMLGGHSLLATQLLQRIEREFGVHLTVAALFGAPTLAQQAQLLQRWDDRPFDFRKLVQLNAEGGNRPLIVVHNTGVYCYHLAQLLGQQQPVTALQIFDPASPELLPTSIEDIAAEYVQSICKLHPKGPYRLLGWCIGGVLSFEIACQLTALGHAVSFLGLIDAWAPGNLRRMPKARAWLADRSYRTQLILAEWRKVRSGQHSFGDFLRKRVIVRKLLGEKDVDNDRPLMSLFGERHLSDDHYNRWLVAYLDEVSSRYTPRPYSGRVTLVRSSREPSGLFLDPMMGWSSFVPAGIDTAVLDGDHFTVFRDIGLQQLATLLAQALAS